MKKQPISMVFLKSIRNQFVSDAIPEVIAILATTVILVLACCFFYFWKKYSTKPIFHRETLSVIDFIEAIGRICPVSPWNEWKLIDSNYGSPRCWHRIFPVKVFGENLAVYGCSVTVSGCSLAVIKMIANPSKWKEWKPIDSSRKYFLRPFKNPQIKNDCFMRTAKIVTETDEVESYRFSHLASTNLGWILFWNVKDINWAFFLVQPIKRQELEHCTLTYIHGFCQLLEDDTLLKKMLLTVNSIKDAIESSLSHIIPFSSYLHDLTAQELSNIKKLKTASTEDNVQVLKIVSAPRVDLGSERVFTVELDNIASNNFHSKCSLTNRGLKHCTVSATSKRIVDSSSSTESSSENEDKGKPKSSFRSSDQVPKSNHSELMKTRSQTFPQLNNENINQTETEIKSSSLDLGLQLRRISSVVRENFTSLLKPTEVTVSEEKEESKDDSQEEIAEATNKLMSDTMQQNMYSRHSSAFEVLLSDPVVSDQRTADLKTKGNYSASELQAELLDASNINLQSCIEDHSSASGRWVFHSVVKGITVLTKYSDFSKTLSFLCTLIIPAKLDLVWKIVKNPRSRFICDDSIKKVRILEEISDDQKVVYIYQEATHLLRKEPVDFCLLHTERQEGDKFYLAFLTLEYGNCPLMDTVTRGTLLPSGWAVEPEGEDNTKVTYLYQIFVNDPHSLFVQDLSTTVPETLYNLRNYVLSGPGGSS